MLCAPRADLCRELFCASVAVIFAASLLYANGGELRLYAAAGFFGALAVVVWLLKTLLF